MLSKTSHLWKECLPQTHWDTSAPGATQCLEHPGTTLWVMACMIVMGNPQKSHREHPKKRHSPQLSVPQQRALLLPKTRLVSTKSAKSKGNKIAGMPNKRGKQIVSSTTKSSPRGKSPSQDTKSTQLRNAPPETRASLDNVMGANRKPPPNTRASGDNVRGIVTTKE